VYKGKKFLVLKKLCFTEVNPEEGAGDNGPEVPGGEELALQMDDSRI